MIGLDLHFNNHQKLFLVNDCQVVEDFSNIFALDKLASLSGSGAAVTTSMTN